MEVFKKYWYAIIMMVVGIVFFLVAIFIDTRLGETAIGIVKMSLGILMFFLLDKIFLKNVDTIDEIKKGNNAVGSFFIAYAIIYAASMLSN